MKNYMITLTVICGEYEKTTRQLVLDAPNDRAATRYAMYQESHDPENLEFDEWGHAIDMGGEFGYKLSGSFEVREAEVEIIKPYVCWGQYNADEYPFVEEE